MYRIFLFAVLKDAARSEVLVLDDPRPELSTSELLEACGEACPTLAKYLSHVRVAVDQEYASGDVQIRPDQEIALLPPVAGGAR